jgi:1-acyl-sn-glycerol-3-phosphate acyltransferase
MTRRIPIGRRFWGAVLKTLIFLLSRLEVRGREKLPAEGAGIVYYNHIHWLDPVLFCGSCRRYAVPLAKIESRSWPLVGWLLKWYHVIFITRGVVDREALKAAWRVLTDGDVAVIAPEGTRSLDGNLQSAKAGLAFLARQVPDAWLMPCAVTGTPQFAWNIGLILHPPHIVLTYGVPFRFRWPKGKVERDVLEQMTDEAMAHLAACLPVEMRGAYRNSDSSTTRWLEFLVSDAEGRRATCRLHTTNGQYSQLPVPQLQVSGDEEA